MTALPYTAEVAAYLAGCAGCAVPLDRRYHPTEDGAVKFIPHRRHADQEADQRAEQQIRAAFRALTTTSPRRGTRDKARARKGPSGAHPRSCRAAVHAAGLAGVRARPVQAAGGQLPRVQERRGGA